MESITFYKIYFISADSHIVERIIHFMTIDYIIVYTYYSTERCKCSRNISVLLEYSACARCVGGKPLQNFNYFVHVYACVTRCIYNKHSSRLFRI